MLLQTLRADWDARGTNARIATLPEFIGGALTIGAGTKLASLSAQNREAEAERAIALLSVALGRPLEAPAAARARRALARARDGDAPLALTHLALAGVGRLDDPREDARRLFIADGLMKAGTPPSAILAALSDAPAPNDFDRAYDPNQPRVPAGNGGASGQWTSGDGAGDADSQDQGASSRAPNSANAIAPARAQIADASENWTQYLNPVGSADAAESGGAPFNGPGPYAQHQLGVAAAIAHYQALGYAIFASGATAVDVPGFSSPRVYDFVVQSPDGLLIGVEVKTTLGETIFLNPLQVARDVALMLDGGGVAHVSGASIRGVAYTTYCRACDKIDIRGLVLYNLLKLAKIPFSFDRMP